MSGRIFLLLVRVLNSVVVVSAAIHFFGCRYSFEGAIEISRRIALDDEDRPDN